jgi:2-hydroxychromene-2-carboxylate isomerase
MEKDPLRFYFSFRSPYSWLAFHRIDDALAGLPVVLDRIPVFPPPNYANDPAKIPHKAAYIRTDVGRIAEAWGLAYRVPEKLDCDWIRPHAAFLCAKDDGKDRAFGNALYAARWSRGLDLGDDAVVRAAATEAGLDPDAVLAAASDEAFHKRVWEGMIQGAGEDGIFGVPYFVFRGDRYWGNDRIEWLVRAIRRAHGIPVVDLGDPLTPLDRPGV